MNLTYSIKNFRVFDTNGTLFNLKPITILTGANCAGKSSLVKSLMLLRDYFKRGEGYDYSPEKMPLSFSDEKVYINGFDNVLNHKCGENKNITFSLARKGTSDNVVFKMDLFFSSKENDLLNDGWLNRICFSCIIDGVSDTFLDVHFNQDGSFDYNTANLSGNIYREFKRNLDIASYWSLFSDCEAEVNAGFFNDNHPDKTDLTHLDSQFERLLGKIRNNQLNKTLDLSYKPKPHAKRSIHSRRYEREPDICMFSDLKTRGLHIDTYQLFDRFNLLMYLPILKTIGDLDPSHLKEYLDEQKEYDWRCLSIADEEVLNPDNGEDSICDMFDAVVKAFSLSGRETFVEFYRDLENNALKDIGELAIENKWGNAKWRNVLINHHGRTSSGSGFLGKTNDVINMLANLGDIEYYESQFVEKWFSRRQVDFYYVYRVLTYLERKRDITDKENYLDDFGNPVYVFKDGEGIRWTDSRSEWQIDFPESYVFVEYKSFLQQVINDFLQCREIAHITSVGSFLCPALRSYSIYDKSNPLSAILLTYVNAIRKINKTKDTSFEAGTFVNRWIKGLGIGRSVSIKMTEDRTAIQVLIVGKNSKQYSSADYGHGVTQILSILLNIETEIILSRMDKYPVTICFEEPEVSLHPSWQSKLALVFRDAYETYGIHFILETHSEYLTRVTQAMVARECETENDLKRFPFVVYYMEKNGSAYDLEYQLSGRFKRSFGPGFFDEASRSSIEILKREKKMMHE